VGLSGIEKKLEKKRLVTLAKKKGGLEGTGMKDLPTWTSREKFRSLRANSTWMTSLIGLTPLRGLLSTKMCPTTRR